MEKNKNKKKSTYWKSYYEIMVSIVIYLFQHLSVLKSLESLQWCFEKKKSSAKAYSR